MHQMVSANLDASRRWWVLAIVVAAQFMFGVDAFVVNVALPTIAAELHASAAQVESVIAIYLIAYATLVVTGGRLGDIYGNKRVFLAGVLGFTLTSLWCGLAQSGPELIAARLAALRANAQFSRARRAATIESQRAELLRARIDLQQVARQLQAAKEGIDGQLKAYAAPASPQAQAEKERLIRAQQQAELELGINALNQARSYTETSEVQARAASIKRAVSCASSCFSR